MSIDTLIEQYKDPLNLEARILLHERFSLNERRWPLWVFDQLEISSHSQILELGCGVMSELGGAIRITKDSGLYQQF